MKKDISLLLLISFISITAYSQVQRQIINKYCDNYLQIYSEQFQVIKKGHAKIKDGWYLRYEKSALAGIAVFEPALLQKGFYKNNHYCIAFYQGLTHCFMFKYDNKRQP